MDRAGAAVAGVAAHVRPRQVEVVADEVDEQAARVDLALVDVAVDVDRDRATRGRLFHAHRPRSDCLRDRAHGAGLREVPPVVGGRVDVGRRVERRVGDGLPNALLVGSARRQQDGHRVDAAERDPRRAAGEARRRVRDAGAVATDRDRRESVRRVGGRRHGHGREQLAFADDGHVDAEEELLGRHGSLAGLAPDRHRRADRDEQRRQVVGRIVRADVAADRAAVAHLHVRDLRCYLRQDRPRDLDLGRVHDLRVGRHRAELERVAADPDRTQVVEPVQIDEHVRGRRARLHHVHERLAAGERTGAFIRRQEANGVVDRPRPRVLDLTQKHDWD